MLSRLAVAWLKRLGYVPARSKWSDIYIVAISLDKTHYLPLIQYPGIRENQFTRIPIHLSTKIDDIVVEGTWDDYIKQKEESRWP